MIKLISFLLCILICFKSYSQLEGYLIVNNYTTDSLSFPKIIIDSSHNDFKCYIEGTDSLVGFYREGLSFGFWNDYPDTFLLDNKIIIFFNPFPDVTLKKQKYETSSLKFIPTTHMRGFIRHYNDRGEIDELTIGGVNMTTKLFIIDNFVWKIEQYKSGELIKKEIASDNNILINSW